MNHSTYIYIRLIFQDIPQDVWSFVSISGMHPTWNTSTQNQGLCYDFFLGGGSLQFVQDTSALA